MTLPPNLPDYRFTFQCLPLLHIACWIADFATEDVGRLSVPCLLHTAIVIATACSRQYICLARLDLLVCPTRPSGAVGIGAWGVFLGARMVPWPLVHRPSSLQAPACLLHGYPWEVDSGSVTMVTSLLPGKVSSSCATFTAPTLQ